jgi:hypothetical protein
VFVTETNEKQVAFGFSYYPMEVNEGLSGTINEDENSGLCQRRQPGRENL